MGFQFHGKSHVQRSPVTRKSADTIRPQLEFCQPVFGPFVMHELWKPDTSLEALKAEAGGLVDRGRGLMLFFHE